MNPTDTRRRTPPRTLWAVTVAGALLVLGAGAIRTWLDRDAGDEVARAAASAPGIEHVHGLGLNPADDSLVVATHYGTFRLADKGGVERVGDSFQDTMGFTVLGSDRFLGSGHPDVAGLRRGDPPQLGLIESSDAGRTWRSLSLRGKADLHGLAYQHDRVYAWDATRSEFMVSRDKRAWEVRSTVDLLAFAVDPDQIDHVVGAGPQGLIVSHDGGRTWGALGGPDLIALSWDDETGLWGVAADGSTHHSEDGGASWRAAGRLPGEPSALLAAEGVLYAAVHEDEITAIYRSEDRGASWKLRHRDGRGS